MGRWRVIPLVRESLGVERRKLDGGRGVRKEGLVARSVEVDAKRELLNPLRYGEGRDSERDACIGLLAETGGGQGTIIPSWKGPKGYASVAS